MDCSTAQKNVIVTTDSKMILCQTQQTIIGDTQLNKASSNQTQDIHQLLILVITWNMMGKLPQEGSLSRLLAGNRRQHDLIVIGSQQCQRSQLMSMCCDNKSIWEMMISDSLDKSHIMIDSETLNGIHVVAFLRKQLWSQLTIISKDQIKTGMHGMAGNKGAVRLTIALGVKTFSFICTHLNADHDKFQYRNKNLMKIISQLIPNQHSDEVFFFGDLNYRMTIAKSQISKFNTLINLKQYIQYDQLKQQVILTDFLKDYTEGDLNFPPTYKLLPYLNIYNNTRIPGWTDRIFFRSKFPQLKQLDYYSDMEIKGSDHRPVFASFQTNFPKNYQFKTQNKLRQSQCQIF